VIIFLHIQKTSGSSINYILKNQKFSFWFKYFAKKGHVPDIISGHFPYGVHKQFDTEEFSYFTFLRDPVQRWISQFYHGIESEDSWGSELFNRNKRDLKRFMNWCLEKEVACNLMVKQISGLEKKENVKSVATRKYSADKDFGYHGMFGWNARKEHNTDKDMEEMLQVAKYNIKEKIDFVGYVDNGHKDQIRLCDYYGLRKYGEVMKRVSKRSIKFPWEDKSIQDLLKEINKYDISFYKFVRRSNI